MSIAFVPPQMMSPTATPPPGHSATVGPPALFDVGGFWAAGGMESSLGLSSDSSGLFGGFGPMGRSGILMNGGSLDRCGPSDGNVHFGQHSGADSLHIASGGSQRAFSGLDSVSMPAAGVMGTVGFGCGDDDGECDGGGEGRTGENRSFEADASGGGGGSGGGLHGTGTWSASPGPGPVFLPMGGPGPGGVHLPGAMAGPMGTMMGMNIAMPGMGGPMMGLPGLGMPGMGPGHFMHPMFPLMPPGGGGGGGFLLKHDGSVMVEGLHGAPMAPWALYPSHYHPGVGDR
jgi:hypothetical protein